MRILHVAVLAATLFLNACSWQTYAVSRGIRHLTGAPTRFHTIVPLSGRLQQYRAIEVQPLDNLILGLLPEKMETYIDDQIFKDLQSIKAKPKVVRYSDFPPAGDDASAYAGPSLVFRGYVDDFDAGYASLRLAEIGFNHVAVTIRFELRDKQTGEVVAAASITSQDDRSTGTTKSAVNKIARRIGSFVNSGYGGGE